MSRDLFWYRSTLAHNAPRLDGADQPPAAADCLAFDARDGWAWAVGRLGDVSRTVLVGPAYVVDLVELTGEEERLLEVPLILFLVIVAPIWIIAHYTTRWRMAKTLSPEDEKQFAELWQIAERMEQRIDSIERILEVEEPRGERT